MSQKLKADLCTYAVYDHPSDYPDSYVVRRFYGMGGEAVPEAQPLMVTRDLETIRDAMRYRGLTCLPRFANDEPQILEVWM
jgi:hypothetical protein